MGGNQQGSTVGPARGFESGVRSARARLARLDRVNLRERFSLLGIMVLAWFATFAGSWIAYDSYAYWAVNPGAPYNFDLTPDQHGAFRYSPAAAQVISLAHFLPWPVFAIAWLLLLGVVLAWLGRRWTLAMLAFAPIMWDAYLGNIEILLAGAIVLSFRWPGAWSFVLLTKVTPGIGLLWYVVRREWRNLAIALGTTVAIVAVSFALAPDLWFAWPRSILAVQGRPGALDLVLRIGAALLLVAWGARTDRRWVLIVAGTLALGWLDLKTTAMLAGLGAFLPRLPGDGPGPLPPAPRP